MSARTRMTNLTPGYAINSIIAIAIMIGFKYVVTPSDPLTPLGVEILGIFLGVVWGWLLCGGYLLAIPVWPGAPRCQRLAHCARSLHHGLRA